MTSTTSNKSKPRWRRKRWILAGILALVIVPSAIAGWIVYISTVSGSVAANVQSTGPTQTSVLQLSPSASTALAPGGAATNIAVSVQNNGTVPESIATIAPPTITDNQSNACAPFVSWQTAGTTALTSHTPFAVGASGPYTLSGAVLTSNAMPAACTNAVITFTFSGASTTSP